MPKVSLLVRWCRGLQTKAWLQLTPIDRKQPMVATWSRKWQVLTVRGTLYWSQLYIIGQASNYFGHVSDFVKAVSSSSSFNFFFYFINTGTNVPTSKSLLYA
jgi:hypothetical protein